MKKTLKREVKVCDSCGREADLMNGVFLMKCEECGKDVCPNCYLEILYRDPALGIYLYHLMKIVCKAHYK